MASSICSKDLLRILIYDLSGNQEILPDILVHAFSPAFTLLSSISLFLFLYASDFGTSLVRESNVWYVLGIFESTTQLYFQNTIEIQVLSLFPPPETEAKTCVLQNTHLLYILSRVHFSLSLFNNTSLSSSNAFCRTADTRPNSRFHHTNQ